VSHDWVHDECEPGWALAGSNRRSPACKYGQNGSRRTRANGYGWSARPCERQQTSTNDGDRAINARCEEARRPSRVRARRKPRSLAGGPSMLSSSTRSISISSAPEPCGPLHHGFAIANHEQRARCIARRAQRRPAGRSALAWIPFASRVRCVRGQPVGRPLMVLPCPFGCAAVRLTDFYEPLPQLWSTLGMSMVTGC
jgi:hypothetical protein